MRTGMPLAIIGISMFILGLLLFYLINPERNGNLEFMKYMGTFVGLSGMGVTLAGLLLHLLSRNEQPIKENYDIENDQNN
jgi:hypothetical protein